MTLRLTLTVDYNPNGTPTYDLAQCLDQVVGQAISKGTLTSSTAAEVQSFRCVVEEITEQTITQCTAPIGSNSI